MQLLIYFLSALFCVIWHIFLLKNIHILLTIPLFEKVTPPPPPLWPKLSVVVTACNEASTIGPATNSILNQDYPNLEVILVNDRSTDNTAEIIEEISKRDARVIPIHITRLPEKWLGKVHALNVASKIVSGEWVLFTDADVSFRHGVFRRAIALSISRDYDHLTLIPRITSSSFWFDVLLKTFGAFLLQSVKSLKFAGIGAFNLVKRSALDKTEGFQWLRMEVADDMGLGLLLYRCGAKSLLSLSLHDVHLTWYSSISKMVHGLEKNMFSISRYRFTNLLPLFFFLWMMALGPVYLLLFSPHPAFFYSGVFGYLLFLINAIIGRVRFREKLIPALFIQAGLIMLSLVLLRSGLLCKLRGGIIWRGTFYSVKELIRGQRLL